MRKRNQTISISLILAIAAFNFSCKQSNEIKHPNILFILVDDQRNGMLGVEGHPIIKTPTMDSLSNEGTRFKNAFVTTSICTASRASILSGLHEKSHNFTFKDPFSFTGPLKKEFMNNSYPALLRKAGYRTGFVGKFGVQVEGGEQQIDSMFHYFRPSPFNHPYVKVMDDGSKKHSLEVVRDDAIAFIRQQSSKTPFSLSISFNAVHAVDNDKTPGNNGHYPYPDAESDLYEDLEIPAPRLLQDKIVENHPDFLMNSLNRERFFWRWDTPEKYETNMRAYYRMISGYDRVVGEILSVLSEQGLDKNTVIIFAADNGYYMGDRGFAGKWTHYEESLRIPLMIIDPRQEKASRGKVVEQMALNLDIPSTIVDFASLDIPDQYQGASLLPVLAGQTANWRRDFFFEHRMNYNVIPKLKGIRDERYVYANYYEQEPPYEFLHDLEADPDQLDNLVNNPAYASVLERLRTRCDSIDVSL